MFEAKLIMDAFRAEGSNLREKSLADRLRRESGNILELWEKQVRAHVVAARNLEPTDLRNAIPAVLEALAVTIENLDKSEEPDIKISQAHGLERANRPQYSIKQVILEYRLLRRTILDVLAPAAPIDPRAINAIINAIEVGIAEATSAFADYQYRLREQFISTLAHDLRNPLTAAKAAAQIILRFPENVDSTQILSARVVDSIARTERMIKDLLDSNLVRSGGCLPLNFERGDMRAIIKMTLEETASALGDHFVFEFGPQPVFGYWDIGYIKRAVENLAVNAVKHGDINYPVKVTLTETKGEVVIAVQNMGAPISRSDLETIFDPFQRAARAKKLGKPGWGIGLSLVKGIAEAHGGRVSVQSQEKTGTTFTLTLPIDALSKTKKAG